MPASTELFRSAASGYQASCMKHIVYHITIPAALTVAFFVIALMPVEVLGCPTRGLIAVLIAFICGLAALGAAIKGVKGKARGDTNTAWWMTSTLILMIPVIALIVMA
jgi:heme O synthase-like polyprenyltransferase